MIYSKQGRKNAAKQEYISEVLSLFTAGPSGTMADCMARSEVTELRLQHQAAFQIVDSSYVMENVAEWGVVSHQQIQWPIVVDWSNDLLIVTYVARSLCLWKVSKTAIFHMHPYSSVYFIALHHCSISGFLWKRL